MPRTRLPGDRAARLGQRMPTRIRWVPGDVSCLCAKASFQRYKRIACLAHIFILVICLFSQTSNASKDTNTPGVAVLLVDTDRNAGKVEAGIYGQFLEHINHSVEGLFAEQIQGRGFEGKDFETYWKPFAENGSASIANVKFEHGEKSLRLQAASGSVVVRQSGIYLQQGFDYNGSVWLKPETGALQIKLLAKDSGGNLLATSPLRTSGTNWQEVAFSFSNSRTDA